MVKPAGLLSNRYEVKDMPDLTGKVAIVVGGSRGIGEAAVHALVQKDCRGEQLFILCAARITDHC
jgi:NADP-dependent 3-hydroxy acid dehydrogenase YdfG